MINAQSVTPPLTGVGHYTSRLISGLARREDLHLRCFRDVGLIDPPLPDRDGILPKPPPEPMLERQLPRAIRAQISRLPAARGLYRRWRRRTAWRSVSSITDGLYHEPNNVLERLDLPAVVTIHDLSTVHYPETHPADRIRFFERRWPLTIERAAQIITVSEFTRRDVIESLSADPAKVTAIHNGVSADFRPYPVDELWPCLARHGLRPGSYLLSVGTVEPRKNLRSLVSAYRRLPGNLRRRFPLVLAGPQGWGDHDFAATLNDLNRNGEIRLLGYVAQNDLPLLYAGAAGFAYLSIYEGFGLPVLEAMASGVPVLTSIDTVMAEVAEDAALYAPPKDIDAITEALRKLVEDDQLRNRSRAAGPKRAAAFSWEVMVDKTIDVYRRVQA